MLLEIAPELNHLEQEGQYKLNTLSLPGVQWRKLSFVRQREPSDICERTS